MAHFWQVLLEERLALLVSQRAETIAAPKNLPVAGQKSIGRRNKEKLKRIECRRASTPHVILKITLQIQPLTLSRSNRVWENECSSRTQIESKTKRSDASTSLLRSIYYELAAFGLAGRLLCGSSYGTAEWP
jgi:hypothetical protein